MLNIIGNKNIFLTISAALIAVAVGAIVIFGFREGIDFQGGTLWSVSAGDSAVTAENMEQAFHDDLGALDVHIARDAAGGFLVKLPALDEAQHAAYAEKLTAKFSGFAERSFQSIGPSVGAEVRKNALVAIALVLVGISLYIAFAFRKVMRPVSSWTYGWITLATLFHDVVIPAGMLAALGRYRGIEIDGNFVVALLVVMGFSVHDTIVVFDRIRENIFHDRGKSPFAKVVNDSVNQSIARSVNTSLTLILVLIALYVAGPATLSFFILTLLVGVTTGIYSSIFMASPLLVAWQQFRSRKAG
ncbi:MAG: hypothetical protein RL681_286 [Candidatus Parcubacteria bacterium]|jgi:preprotein translocase subunit SecF